MIFQSIASVSDLLALTRWHCTDFTLVYSNLFPFNQSCQLATVRMCLSRPMSELLHGNFYILPMTDPNKKSMASQPRGEGRRTAIETELAQP